MELQNEFFLSDCITAEKRKERPHIHEESVDCPFCLEKSRKNIDETLIRIWANKYPVADKDTNPYGVHDVVIDTPFHKAHPKDFSSAHWEKLLDRMQQRWHEICNDSRIQFIQLFKNHGKIAGASISHSHWQILALEKVPYSMEEQYRHYNQYKGCYLCDLLKNEEASHLLCENEAWYMIGPKAPRCAYETWLVPKKHHQTYGTLSSEELRSCGELIKALLLAYEAVEPGCAFNICFMSGGISCTSDYHFHIKIMMRLGNVAGFELATGTFINMIPPEMHIERIKKLIRE